MKGVEKSRGEARKPPLWAKTSSSFAGSCTFCGLIISPDRSFYFRLLPIYTPEPLSLPPMFIHWALVQPPQASPPPLSPSLVVCGSGSMRVWLRCMLGCTDLISTSTGSRPAWASLAPCCDVSSCLMVFLCQSFSVDRRDQRDIPSSKWTHSTHITRLFI